MNLKNPEEWKRWVESNTDPYGSTCVKVGQRVMELLDKGEPIVSARDLVHQADREVGNGITGFMAGAVAAMVSGCHERGEEFRQKWNTETQIQNEGDFANASGGVLNPALMSVQEKTEDDA